MLSPACKELGATDNSTMLVQSGELPSQPSGETDHGLPEPEEMRDRAPSQLSAANLQPGTVSAET